MPHHLVMHALLRLFHPTLFRIWGEEELSLGDADSIEACRHRRGRRLRGRLGGPLTLTSPPRLSWRLPSLGRGEGIRFVAKYSLSLFLAIVWTARGSRALPGRDLRLNGFLVGLGTVVPGRFARFTTGYLLSSLRLGLQSSQRWMRGWWATSLSIRGTRRPVEDHGPYLALSRSDEAGGGIRAKGVAECCLLLRGYEGHDGLKPALLGALICNTNTAQNGCGV